MKFDELLERLAERERRILHMGMLIGFSTSFFLVVVMELATDFFFYISVVLRELRALR